MYAGFLTDRHWTIVHNFKLTDVHCWEFKEQEKVVCPPDSDGPSLSLQSEKPPPETPVDLRTCTAVTYRISGNLCVGNALRIKCMRKQISRPEVTAKISTGKNFNAQIFFYAKMAAKLPKYTGRRFKTDNIYGRIYKTETDN